MGGENEGQASYSYCGRVLMKIRLQRPEGLGGRRGARRVGQRRPQSYLILIVCLFAVDDCVFKYHFITYV